VAAPTAGEDKAMAVSQLAYLGIGVSDMNA
jgi:hypothetical protein